MFLLPGLLLLILGFLLPPPWNVVALVVPAALVLSEIAFWAVCIYRKPVDAETLIGRVATVVEPCEPSGRVRVGGETWRARCDDWADLHDEVKVRGSRDGLTLVVERA
jgi:membrane protein implicated in regulation of membrane protease activity